MKCLIICSSSDVSKNLISKFNLEDFYVISADGGLEFCEKYGIIPDLWVGDRDSLNSSIINAKEKKFFPEDKDLTDSHIAAIEAIKRGYKEIFFIGVTGGRLDHEYSNYCLLKFVLKNGGFATILNANNRVFMADKSISVDSDDMKYISFFPFGGNVEDFSVYDVKYPLDNYVLTDDDTYTTSNEFLAGKSAKINFKNGYVIVFCSNESRE